jgi:hypothetical protein
VVSLYVLNLAEKRFAYQNPVCEQKRKEQARQDVISLLHPVHSSGGHSIKGMQATADYAV